MATAILDTHGMVKRLVGTGMPEAQAEVVVDLVNEAHDQLVTREILRYELALVEERLGKRTDELESRLGRRVDGLDSRIGALDKDLTIRLGGMLAAAVAMIGALVVPF